MTRLGTPERDKSGPKSSELPDDATGWGLIIDDKLKAGGGDLRHGGTELGGQLGLGGRPVELRRRVEDAPDLLDQRHRAMMVRRVPLLVVTPHASTRAARTPIISPFG